MKRFPVGVSFLWIVLMYGAMVAIAPAADDAGRTRGASTKGTTKKVAQKRTDGNKGPEQKPPDQNAPEKKPEDTTKTAGPPPQLEHREGEIANIGKDGASLLIKTQETQILSLQVKDQAPKDGLKNWHVGDKVKAAVNVDKKDGVETLTLWNLESQKIVLGEWWMPALAMFGSLVALLLLTWLLTLKFGGILALLFIGQDGKYSN